MKSIRIISALLIAGLLFAVGCNKDKYTKGAAQVSGTVTYKNGATGTTDAAPYANVHIKYNTTAASTTYDLTLEADSTGKFTVKLPTGNYYFFADYTDMAGFKYSTVQGSVVKVNNTDDQVSTVAIIVQ
jgi:hypothetical protein